MSREVVKLSGKFRENGLKGPGFAPRPGHKLTLSCQYMISLFEKLHIREPLRRGRLSTVDLLVLTRLDEPLLILETKQATLMRRSMVLRPVMIG